jgi:hypothetical protein
MVIPRSYYKENKYATKSIVTILSILLVTFSFTSMGIGGISNNDGMTLIQEANAAVSISDDIDQLEDCDGNNNCVAEQPNVIHTGSGGSGEDVKVERDIVQLLNCEDSDCFDNSDFYALQEVETSSATTAVVDYDVDMEINQESDGRGQDDMDMNNYGEQGFFVTASNTAKVLADGDGKDVRFTMTQTNDECDDTFCGNEAYQYYDLIASGNTKIDVTHNSGFNVEQTNNGCDDRDVDFEIDCTNYAEQGLDISTSGTGYASVFYDSKDPDDDTNDIVQTNNCDFGDFDCYNTAYTYVDIGAVGTSKVHFDDVVQDVSQGNNCEDLFTDTINYDDTGCGNYLNMALNIDTASTNGLVTHEGDNPTHIQEATQTNTCNNADCFNDGEMYVNIGQGNAVDGILKTDYKQQLSQSNGCTTGADCSNYAKLLYTAFSDGGATVTSVSNQAVTQSSNCHYGASCANIGYLTNNVFGSGTAKLTETTNQVLQQSCNESGSSDSCLNLNTLYTSGTATSTAVLSYTANQNINSADADGTASINIVRNSGTSNLGTISQTSIPSTYP